MGLDGDDGDEPLELSSSAMAALKEFLADKEKMQAAEKVEDADPFREDWSMSQFWYDEATAKTMAAEVKRLGGRVACLACPSLYRQMMVDCPEVDAQLFEFDRRFEQLEKFTFYDYNDPEDVPDYLHREFDVVVADPPYLAEECLVKTARTMRLLLKQEGGPLILLTGAVMREVALRELKLKPAKFRPEHKNKLGNEFLCYTSYEPAQLGGWDREEFPELFAAGGNK